MTSRPTKTLVAAAGLLLPLAALTGCGSVQAAAGLTPAPAAAATSTATPTATPTPVAVVPVQNDLALGSAHHELQAGGMTLAVNYWSTLDMGAWTAEAAKPVQLAATITGPNLGTAKKQQKAYVSNFTVTSSLVAADGTETTGATVQDTSRQTPGYLAMAPYAYSTSFVIPAVPAGTRSVELLISYDVLEQSAPGAADYSKQTATDSLTLAIAQPTTR
ncbi:hypothetical protein CLV37_102322 [Kineococcus rhizosphaerae]|uniref:Lipoprotein n=2 Tax=Kineococcus rhizosphaerae TaxID=559628 RepID=A0A2T0R869_9ACTN|nr:hypothetical protein CLV37_102322 [Kineococcus rhizosphaerae]